MLQVGTGDGEKVGCLNVQVTCLSVDGNLLTFFYCFSVLVRGCLQVPVFLLLLAGSSVGGCAGRCLLLACLEPSRSCWLHWGLAVPPLPCRFLFQGGWGFPPLVNACSDFKSIDQFSGGFPLVDISSPSF